MRAALGGTGRKLVAYRVLVVQRAAVDPFGRKNAAAAKDQDEVRVRHDEVQAEVEHGSSPLIPSASPPRMGIVLCPGTRLSRSAWRVKDKTLLANKLAHRLRHTPQQSPHSRAGRALRSTRTGSRRRRISPGRGRRRQPAGGSGPGSVGPPCKMDRRGTVRPPGRGCCRHPEPVQDLK